MASGRSQYGGLPKRAAKKSTKGGSLRYQVSRITSLWLPRTAAVVAPSGVSKRQIGHDTSKATSIRINLSHHQVRQARGERDVRRQRRCRLGDGDIPDRGRACDRLCNASSIDVRLLAPILDSGDGYWVASMMLGPRRLVLHTRRHRTANWAMHERTDQVRRAISSIFCWRSMALHWPKRPSTRRSYWRAK